MFYRPINAALMALACVVFFGSLAKADTQCTTKEQLVGMIMADHPNVIATDFNGEHEKMFLRGLSKISGNDLSMYDAVIFRNPGFKTTLVMLFKGGCANLQTEFPNNQISEIIGRGV